MISKLNNNVEEFELKEKTKNKRIKDILQKKFKREIFKTDKNINIIKEY